MANLNANETSDPGDGNGLVAYTTLEIPIPSTLSQSRIINLTKIVMTSERSDPSNDRRRELSIHPIGRHHLTAIPSTVSNQISKRMSASFGRCVY